MYLMTVHLYLPSGQVRLMTTGASPISEEVFDFLRICFGATVIEVSRRCFRCSSHTQHVS